MNDVARHKLVLRDLADLPFAYDFRRRCDQIFEAFEDLAYLVFLNEANNGIDRDDCYHHRTVAVAPDCKRDRCCSDQHNNKKVLELGEKEQPRWCSYIRTEFVLTVFGETLFRLAA